MAFGTILKDLPAIRCRDAQSGTRLPSRGKGGGARSEPREEALAVPMPPFPSERQFDELPVRILVPEAVQDAEATVLVVLQPLVAGPAVGQGTGSRSGRVPDERLPRRAGLVHDLAKLGAPGLDPVEHLDRPGDHQPALVAAPARRRLGVPEAIGNVGFVRLHARDQRKPVGDGHRSADLLRQHSGRLAAPQVRRALELQGRHPVRMRGHEMQCPVPVLQRHVRAVHERLVRHRRLIPAVAVLVNAALAPNRVPAPAVWENEAVRPICVGTELPRVPRRSGTDPQTDRWTAHSEKWIDSSCAAYDMNV